MSKSVEKPVLPAQIESMISSLLNEKQSVHVRNNYRVSLDLIASEIHKAIEQFDKDMVRRK